MSCPALCLTSLLKKLSVAALLSLLLVSHQAQATRIHAIVGGNLIIITAFLTLTGLYYDDNHNQNVRHALLDQGMDIMPEITYQVQKPDNRDSGTKIVLTPTITRGHYVHAGKFEWKVNDFLERVICNPILSIKKSGTDTSSLKRQCQNWFKDHQNMYFPHQFLKISADKLDTVMLPKLEFDLGEHSIKVLVSYASYMNEDGIPDKVKVKVAIPRELAAPDPRYPGTGARIQYP